MSHARAVSANLTVLLTISGLLAGCELPGRKSEDSRDQPMMGTTITIQDARTRLGVASRNLLAVVAGAAREFERRSDDLRIRRFSIVIRFRTMQECQGIQQLEDPRIGMLDLLALAHQTLDYFETGDGQTILGDLADLAVPPLRRYAQSLEETASIFVPPDVHRVSLEQVLAFAKANPITGETFVRTSRPSQRLREGSAGILATILELPFKPFEIGKGVGEAAASVDRLSAQADRSTYVIENLPLQLQWNLQYLLLALEDNRTVDAALAEVRAASDAVQTASDAMRAAAAAADDLPAKVGTEIRTTLDEIADGQGEMRATLEEIRQVAADSRATIASVDEASTALAAAGEAWLPTAKALDALFNPPEDPDEPVDPDPFKMPQVTEAANALTATAQELRTLVADLRGLIGAEEIPGTLTRVDDTARSAVDHTAARAEDLTDHITWRGIQLVLVIFGTAFLYRLVTWRVLRRDRPTS